MKGDNSVSLLLFLDQGILPLNVYVYIIYLYIQSHFNQMHAALKAFFQISPFIVLMKLRRKHEEQDVSTAHKALVAEETSGEFYPIKHV